MWCYRQKWCAMIRESQIITQEKCFNIVYCTISNQIQTWLAELNNIDSNGVVNKNKQNQTEDKNKEHRHKHLPMV